MDHQKDEDKQNKQDIFRGAKVSLDFGERRDFVQWIGYKFGHSFHGRTNRLCNRLPYPQKQVGYDGNQNQSQNDRQHEECHEMGYIDIFRLKGFNRMRVRLELGMRSRNLLVEEYPLAERDIVPCGAGKWMLDTMVCDYAGVGRFVIGLMDDIRIVDTPDLEAYIYNKAKAVLEKVGD